ncbi:MAG: hypothetical protein IT535_15065 [Bauldia sp.]|nr:hypothetical protein [Bauldia sp.]
MRLLPRLLGAFRRDRRGAVTILAAFSVVAAICLSGIVTDTAIIYLHKRRAQGMTDLAAMTAVRLITAADAAARGTLADNGFGGAVSVAVTPGRYTPDAGIAASARFAPGNADPNAVRVVMVSEPPVVLWNVFIGGEAPRVTTEAIATTTGLASIAIGSRLASLNGGVLNSILGQLLGGSINLSVMDYNALLETQVDLVDFIDMLAADVALADDNYGDLADLQVGPADVAGVLGDLLREEGATSSVLLAVSRFATAASGGALDLDELVDLGPLETVPVGGSPGMQAKVSAFDLLFASARLADGAHAAVVETGFDIGAVSFTLKLAIGEGMQETGWVAVGDEGTTVSTAQTRLYLEARVGGNGVLTGNQVRVPIYLEVAAGTATIDDIVCGWNAADSRVLVNARPGIAELWLGNINPANLPNFGSAMNPGSAIVVETPLVRARAYANVEVANPNATRLTFSYSDIASGTLKTIGTSSYLSSALSTLLTEADIEVELLGLGLGLGTVGHLLGKILGDLVTPVDSVIYNALRAAGIGVGELDVRVGGVRCDGSALVY